MEVNLYWTRELSVGVDLIDRQHQQLFDYVNQLLAACLTKKDNAEQSGRMLTFLHNYANEHFRAEEALMEEHHYQALEMHRRQHLGFCRKLQQLERRLLDNPAEQELAAEINEMVIDWLYEHICMEDRALGNFILNQ
ncbi:bacteriohemerythrin [Geothermobacter hydrogeniphilus]|uniref:Hemerythrin-like domain-containing protein n=1 Tax=Geothermobacter hydrogeniphilus TaxID=1969733 RepID=A0A1X0Y8I8_9BACT|nr:bacteriohemerythrin [Geothermobacter hydrogeniphilus]ORJ61520.1 hypothetical protein B5V00_05635 [Geothermobacter hydrogeniphilus]